MVPRGADGRRDRLQRRSPLGALVAVVLLVLTLSPGGASGGAQPDLIVTDLRVTDGSDGHVVVLTVQNIGASEASHSTVAVVADPAGSRTEKVPMLAAGAVVEVQVPWRHGLYGPQAFEVRIDPASAVGESNETNNAFSRSLTLDTAELRMHSVEVPAGPLVRDAPVLVMAYVTNDGPATAYGITFGGYDATVDVMRATQPVPPGSSIGKTIGWWIPKGETDLLEVTVDPGHVLFQKDRSDDTFQVTRTVVDPAPLRVEVGILQVASPSGVTVDTYRPDLYLDLRGDHVPPRTDVRLLDGGKVVKTWSLKAAREGTPVDGLSTLWNEQDGGYRTTAALVHAEEIPDGHLPRYTVEVTTDPGTDWEARFPIKVPHPPDVRSSTAYRTTTFDGRLEGESYSRPDPACAPDPDHGHTRVATTAGTEHALLPRSGCGIGIGQVGFEDRHNTYVYFPETVRFSDFRVRMDGPEGRYEGVLRVEVAGVAVANGSYVLQPSDGFGSFAFQDNTLVPEGRHAVRVSFETTSGHPGAALGLDRIAADRPTTTTPPPADDESQGDGPQEDGSGSTPTGTPGPSHAHTPGPTVPPDDAPEETPGTTPAASDGPRRSTAPTAVPWWVAGPRQGVYPPRPPVFVEADDQGGRFGEVLLTNPSPQDLSVVVEWSVGRTYDSGVSFGRSSVLVRGGESVMATSPTEGSGEGRLFAAVYDAGSEGDPASLHGIAFVPIDEEEGFMAQALERVFAAGRQHGAAVLAGGVSLSALAAGVFVWSHEARRFDLLRWLMRTGLGVGLFSRIHGSKLLDHGKREEIHRLIGERPGVHYREILRTLGVSNGALVHHLQALEREGLVRTERDGRLVRFYQVGEKARAGTPVTERQRRLLDEVRVRPGITPSELAARLGISRQGLHQQLAPLRDAGVIGATPRGRSQMLHLSGRLDERLVHCATCASLFDRGADAGARCACPSCGAT